MRLFCKALASWMAWPCIGALMFTLSHDAGVAYALFLGFIFAIIVSLPGCLLLWGIPNRSRKWLMILGAALGLVLSPLVGAAGMYLTGHGGGAFLFLGLTLAVPSAIGGVIAGVIFSRAQKESAPSTSGDGWWPSTRA